MEYGQFCPVAKATEIIGEKWTLLIIREALMGGSRFNELQRGLSLISPTLLSKRLNDLADHGLLMKKKISGQRGSVLPVPIAHTGSYAMTIVLRSSRRKLFNPFFNCLSSTENV